MKTMFLGMAAACLMAGAAPQLALADQVDPAQARLAAPLPAPKKVVIDGRDWRCDGDVCKGGAQGTDQPAKRECGKLAKAVGTTIVAYTYGKKDLAAADLATCNQNAKS